jgi:hypothetical protein
VKWFRHDIVHQRTDRTKHTRPFRCSHSDPAGVAFADEKAGPITWEWSEYECPGTYDEGSRWFEHGDGIPKCQLADGSRVDPLTDMNVLELWMYMGGRLPPLHVVDRAGEHVAFDPVVAVETSSAVADLNEPWPHHTWWGINGESPSVMRHHVLDDVVAGKRLGALVCASTPVLDPGTYNAVVTDESSNEPK